MRSFLTMTAVLTVGLVLSGCTPPAPTYSPTYSPPSPPPIDYKAKSLLLKPDMTEQQVIGILGQPNSSSLRTCGVQVGRAWQCKTWDYGLRFNGLDIFLQNDGNGHWLVNSWQVRSF